MAFGSINSSTSLDSRKSTVSPGQNISTFFAGRKSITKVIFILMLFVTASISQAALNWEYDSPLTVTETITDIGGGDFRYEYSFENIDTSPIWHFGVYTNFTANSENLFTEYLLWDGPIVSQIDTLYPEYDARNLDSSINYMISGSANGGVDGYADNSIMPSEIASGFSFTSSVFNSSPKHYMYETIASGWIKTNGTGKVAAVGTTVPEPATLILFGFGGLILRLPRSTTLRAKG